MRNQVSSSRRFLPALFILLFAGAVAWTFRQHDARPLSREALDCAQIARNIAQGHGFSTDVIQPKDDGSSFSRPLTGSNPELLHAPLYPALLALIFSFAGESDAVVSAVSLFLFVASAGLLWALAHRLLGQIALPLIIAAAYAVSLSALAMAHAGQPQALTTCLLLWLLLTLTPKNRDATASACHDETGAEDSPRRAFSGSDFGLGWLCALCFLNDYLAVFLVLPLLLRWRMRHDRARGAIFAFGLGFALLALPWWIRNARLTGNPLQSSEWLLLSGQAGTLREWLNGLPERLSVYFSTVDGLPHLLLAPFVLVSLWIRPRNILLARREMAILLATVVFIAVLSVFNHRDAGELLPLSPLLCLVGLVTFHQILSNAWHEQAIGKKMVRALRFEPAPHDATYFQPIVSRSERSWRFQELRLKWLALLRLRLWLRKSDAEETLYSGRWPLQVVFETRSAALLLLLLCVPWLARIAFSPRAQPADTRAMMAPLSKIVPKDRVVVTDAPQAVAWGSSRKTSPLPERVAAVLSPENSAIGALYLSGQALEPRLQRWQGLYQGAEVPGFERVGAASKNALYLKQPSLQESRRAVETNPQSAAAYISLGQGLLQRNQPREALAAFLSAQRLQPKQGAALAGAGFAYSTLKDGPRARDQFAKSLVLAPRSLPALMGMAQVQQAAGQSAAAIALYERVLADYPENPVALNNLASLLAEGKNSLFRALEMARRAATRNPNNASMLDTLGWTCSRLGRRAEALQYLQRAAKLAPANKTISAHLQQVRGS